MSLGDCTLLFDGRESSFEEATRDREIGWYSYHDGARGIITRIPGLIEAYIEERGHAPTKEA